MGYSQERLAHALGVERSTVGRWETGETGPQPWQRPKIARLLRVNAGELETLLANVGTAAAEKASRAEDRAHSRSGGLDLVAIAGLRQQVMDLDARYVSEPSTVLIAEVGKHLGQLAHWHTHAATHIVRRDLYAAQAEAATLMGQLVWDASGRRDHATARNYFGQATAAARELRDPVAEGLALLRTSFVALYGERNPGAGLQLTQRSADITKNTSHVLTGLAVLHAAEAHAMTGQRRDCERALSEAETHLGQIDNNDAAAVLFSPSQFGRLAGSCYLALRNAPRAQKVLEETAELLGDGSKSHAIALGNLALAHIRQRHIDEALAALHHAIDIVEHHRGGGGLNLIFQAGRELKPWRDVPAVQDLHDRLMTLMSAA